jgi:hypothetical protein
VQVVSDPAVAAADPDLAVLTFNDLGHFDSYLRRAISAASTEEVLG